MNNFPSQLQKIPLLSPAEIPGETMLAHFMGTAWQNKKEDSSLPSEAEMIRDVESYLGGLRDTANGLSSPSDQTEDAAHDDYFHVARVRGCTPDIFVRSAFEARLVLFRDHLEAPLTIDIGIVEQIDRALAALCEAVCGPGAATRPVARWSARPDTPDKNWSHSRWVRGHQIFAVLSQGLVLSFHALGNAVRAGERAALKQWAALATKLLDGSGAAFVLTGDMPIEEYMEVVRPSMMPPAAPFCLSGLMSADHRFLVKVMRDMRPALVALHELEPDLHEQLQKALGTVYDQHIHVCERFVGERPSLLTAQHAKKSGPSLIEQFKSLRMKAFDAPVHAPKLSGRCPVQHSAHPTSSQVHEVETDEMLSFAGPVSSPHTEPKRICPKDL